MASNKEEIEEFARALNEEIREKALEGVEFSTEIECFADSVLKMFDDAGVVEEPAVCVRGGRLGRSNWEIAGWAFPPSDDEDLTQLSLLTVLFNDNPDPVVLNADELRRKFELAFNFVEAMLGGHADDLEPAADAAALGRIIHERRRKLQKIVVHLATDGLTQRLREIEPRTVGNVEVACSIWDIDRLSRLGDPKQEEIVVDVLATLGGRGLPCLKVPEEDPHYDAYLCVVPGVLLYHAYEEFGQRLLELNVRAFLSATGKVNKGIRETIRTRPDRFFPFNNGLAMTARSVELRKNDQGHDEIARITGLQIVNGGQTTASIHRAWKLDGAQEEVKKVFVQGKLTVICTTEGDDASFIDLVRSISKYANSQNAVKDDDLEANQPWHITLEKLSRSTWTPDAQSQWYYERSRGSYATAKMRMATTRAKKLEFERRWPRGQLVTKSDLAKAANAWGQHPEIVSRGGQKNFRHFMTTLDDQVRRPALDEEEYKRIVGRLILYRDATRIVNQLKERIPAYRANVVAYVVAYLSLRMPDGLDFDRIWEKQAVPETVKDVLAAWAEPIYMKIVSSAQARNVGEWCKKPECWTAICSVNLSTTADLARFSSKDGSGKSGGGVLDVDDAAALSECLRLTPDEWERLSTWSMRDENVHWKARGIVATLRSYALQNWTRRPSVRQARAAKRMIERWRAEQ